MSIDTPEQQRAFAQRIALDVKALCGRLAPRANDDDEPTSDTIARRETRARVMGRARAALDELDAMCTAAGIHPRADEEPAP